MLQSSLTVALNAVRFASYWRELRGATMIAPYDYVANLLLVSEAVADSSLGCGAIVECGTWRGGMSVGLMRAGGPGRRYVFCDSFAGLPPPEKIDGTAALEWAANTGGPRYFDNCRAERAEFVHTLNVAGFDESKYSLVHGFYVDSLPLLKVDDIAVLRLDCDWYSSTLQCLQRFWSHVLPGGLVIFDDYYDWEGCRKAVHDFLAANSLGEAISRFPGTGFAHVWKQGGTTRNSR